MDKFLHIKIIASSVKLSVTTLSLVAMEPILDVLRRGRRCVCTRLCNHTFLLHLLVFSRKYLYEAKHDVGEEKLC